MLLRLLRYLYARLGRRYTPVILAAEFSLAHLVVLGGLGLLTIYQPMSHGDFWRLLIAGQVLVVLDNAISLKMAYHLLRPVRRWVEGDRGQEATIKAWRSLVDLPGEYIRKRWVYPVVVTTLPWCIYATVQLGLPGYSVLLLFVGAQVILAYGLTLRFFGMELALRPVVEKVARSMPDGVALPRAGVPVRWKLLAGLPIINIITGVSVAGLSTNGQAKLADLGFDVIVAVVFAFTISLELTLLLSRSILGPIDELHKATRKVAEGDLSVRVPVTSTDETGRLTEAFNAAVAGLEEREQLRQAFGSYVDPDVVERVLREGEVVQGEELEVSVLFVDIRDFTAFAERSSAREVVDALNDFFERVVPVVTEHGGHANKFIGDGLLGVFGAPARTADHADRAVAAALHIARLVRASYDGDFGVGIGVNSGPVVAGTIGGGGRLEFTVIGDAVNTAARVERATRVTGDAVLITEATHCLLTRDGANWEERESIELKGKSEEVCLYAPKAMAPAPAPQAALHRPD